MGCQPLDRNRKRADASRSVRPRQSLPGKYLPDVIKNITSADTNQNFTKLNGSVQNNLYFFQLISRRRFQQMEVLEGQNILVTISGKKNRVRVYYLSWLKSKILRTDNAIERRAGIKLARFFKIYQTFPSFRTRHVIFVIFL